MTSILEGPERTDQLEQVIGPSSDPIAGPAAGSLLLHGALFGGLLLYGILNGFFHHNLWGNPGAGGAIQVTLVSSALPLPAEQQNQNVLSTETPSQAPAEPTPKSKQAVDETAIPITGKPVKPQKQNVPKTQPHQPQPKQDYRAQFGEQSGSLMARSTTAQTSSADAPVNISNGDFGTRFPWYVNLIKVKVKQNWNSGQVDPRTPKGAVVQIYFRVNRQGAPSNFRVSTASGSPTLDRSCLLATERVDTFGPLPPDSNDQYLDVTYDCTY
jgi:protein TonB